MGAFDKLMSNPFFNAGIGILQGQTPSRTRPNFAANAMGGLQNAMANRTSIQNQSALETERERQKIEYEQKQNQILAEQEFLARINASSQPTTTSPNRLPTQLSPSGLPNTPPTGQFGGIPPIPGQGENQQGTTTRTQQYVSTLNQRLVQINDALGSGKIPSMPRYNELLVEKAKVEKDIYEATKPQDSPASVLEFEYAKTNDLFPGTLQEWMQAKRGGMELVSDGAGGFTFRMGGSGNKPATDTALEGKIGAGIQLLNDLSLIGDRYADEYLTYQGRLSSGAFNVLDKAGMASPEQQDFLGKRVQFATAVDRMFNQYRKEITGAAASQQELERLQKTMLNTDMGPAQFRAAYDDFVNISKQQLNLNMQLKEKGLGDEQIRVLLDDALAKLKTEDKDVTNNIPDRPNVVIFGAGANK